MKYKFDYKTIQGYYGGNEKTKTACIIHCAFNSSDMAWYVIDGSTNVNLTLSAEALVDGVWAEAIDDSDTFQANNEVNDLEQLEIELEDYYS